MNNVKVNLTKMQSIENDLIVLKDIFLNKISEMNTYLSTIDSNWDGKKSAETLINVEEIKKEYNYILIFLEEKIAQLNKARTTYEKETHKGVESSESTSVVEKESAVSPTLTPQSTIEPTTIPSSTSQPTIEPTLTPVSMPEPTTPVVDFESKEGIVLSNQLLRDLGVVFDNSGNPKKVGNTYVVKQSYGKGFKNNLLFLPVDANGEVPKNLPVLIELHGNNEASNYINITQMPNVMGIRETSNNPNLQTIIIIPQVDNAKYYASDIDPIHEYYTQVKSTFETQDKAFLYGFSAGLHGGAKYADKYGETDLKGVVVFDGGPNSTTLKNISPNIPFLVVASDNKINDVKNTFKYLGNSNIPSKVYDSIDGSLYSWSKINVNEYNQYDSVDPRNQYRSVLEDALRSSNYTNGNLSVVNVSGVGHAEIRDFGTGSYFYDTVLKVLFNK